MESNPEKNKMIWEEEQRKNKKRKKGRKKILMIKIRKKMVDVSKCECI